MNRDEIIASIPKDYRKQASRDLSVFTSSIFGETYVKTFKELFGMEFPSIFFVVRKGNFMTFYRSDNHHQSLRKELGEKLRDKKFARDVVKKLRDHTNWFNFFIPAHPTIKEFAAKRMEFVDNYRSFFAYHQVVYWGGDYIIEHYPGLTETIRALQEVYAYNERVVPDVESYLCRIKVDHLTYAQDFGNFREVGLLFLKDQNTIPMYQDDLEAVESHIIGLSKKTQMVREFSGIGICKGITTGPVQVIHNPNKLYEARPEHIIVTGMTRPQFNHILSQCRGVIANEGNILSHAAILARETGMPCIVGTRNATDILKDGDTVELNATQGLVRILKRA